MDRYRTASPDLGPAEWAGLLVVAGAAAVGLPVWLATGTAATVHTGRWPRLTVSATASALMHWPTHLTNPRAAFPPEVARSLPGPFTFYLCVAFVLTTLGAAGALAFRLLRATGVAGARHGYARRDEVRRHLSATAARTRGRHARPSLTGRVDPHEVGLALGRDARTGRPLWGSVEDSYLYLGPPRSGKGVHLIIPQTIDAPGAVLVTATRPDTLRHTLGLRADRGPVMAFDPQNLADDVPRLRWAPQRGCDDALVAINRARALAAGAQLTAGTTTNGDFWQSMTEAVLRCYLHAAALSGRSMRDVLLWASRPSDPTPVRILRAETDAVPGWAEELAAQSGADPRQRDSVWAGVRRAVDSLADPRVLEACSPGDAEAFDPLTFLTGHGTLYLLGSSGAQLSVAPLVTALVEDLIDAARRGAASSPGGRLDPPVLLLLDEAANIAPLPSLPNLLADGGGSGITTVAVLQSLAQARARWGPHAADALWDAATTKVLLGGLAQADDLTRISRLAGEIDEPTRSRTTGPGGGSVSVSVRRLPALPVERLRCLPPGRAIVLARHAAPTEARLQPWWQRRDAEVIRAATGTCQ